MPTEALEKKDYKQYVLEKRDDVKTAIAIVTREEFLEKYPLWFKIKDTLTDRELDILESTQGLKSDHVITGAELAIKYGVTRHAINDQLHRLLNLLDKIHKHQITV